MQYIRLTLNDSNLQKTKNRLSWEIPLTVGEAKVGLSSISLEVLDHYDPVENLFATIQCNLLDRNMHNQHGVLATVRRHEENYGAFQIVSKKTGISLRCLQKLNYI